MNVMYTLKSASMKQTRRLRVGVLLAALAVAGVSVLGVASSASANPSNCTGEYACQFSGTGYSGDRDYYAKGYADFRYATNNIGVCIREGYQNWYDCAESTFNSHLSVTVGWFTSNFCSGRELQNTPSSGSPNLSATYEGNFMHDLDSLEYFSTPANCG